MHLCLVVWPFNLRHSFDTAESLQCCSGLLITSAVRVRKLSLQQFRFTILPLCFCESLLFLRIRLLLCCFCGSSLLLLDLVFDVSVVVLCCFFLASWLILCCFCGNFSGLLLCSLFIFSVIILFAFDVVLNCFCYYLLCFVVASSVFPGCFLAVS